MLSAEKREKIYRHIPYYDLSNGVLETFSGALAAGFKVKPFDGECSDNLGLGDLNHVFKTMIDEFSEDFQYQVIARNEMILGNGVKTFTIWIQTSPKKDQSYYPAKFEMALKTIQTEESDRNEKLKTGLSKLRQALESAGLQPEPLDDKSILKELSGIFRPDMPAERFSLGSLRQSDLVIREDSFCYDHVHWGAVSVIDLPDELSAGLMTEVGCHQFNSFTCAKITPKNTSDTIEKLKRQRKISASLANTKSRLKDMESEAKLKSEDELLENLVMGQERVFDCQLTTFFCTLDSTTQRFAASATSDSYKSNGLAPYHEAVSLYSVFQSCLPGNPTESHRSFLLPSNCVAALLPLFDVDRGHSSPVIHFKNRFGTDVGIDLWDSSLSSYNAVISGTSGSGKSFLSNVMLQRLSNLQDVSTFIIDIGGSYRRLTNLQGGQYFTFDVNGSNGFNPLGNVSLRDPASLEAAVDIISTIIGDPKLGISKFERNIVLQEITNLLASGAEALTLSAIRRVWLKSKNAFLKNSATILYGWTEDRAYGRLLDNNKRLETNNRWVCFDLRGLNDHAELQRVVMLAIVKRLWEIVRQTDEKKILLLDEVWALISNFSGFIGEAFRTFRKHNASAIAVTQSLEDLATEALTSAVLNNTPTKIILKQSLRPERLQSLLNLNQRELEIASSLRSVKGKYSEFFMINGDRRRFLRLEPTAEDYWISTTNPSDLEFIGKFMAARPELNELQACREIARIYLLEITQTLRATEA